MVATTNISGERIPPVGSEGDVLTVVSGIPDWDSSAPALPTASAAGEFPVSTGAGTTYAALALGAAREVLHVDSGGTGLEYVGTADIVGQGLGLMLAAAPVGTAVIADGAGDISGTSADVSAFLATANAAAARTALGVQDGPRYIPISGYVDVDATQGTRVIGGSPEALDPAASAIAGRTQTWTLIALASVVSGQTGTIELYDLTNTAVAATITVTSATAGTAHTASVTLPGSARRYELRASCTGSTAAHYVTVLNTTIKQSWS